MLFEVFGTIVSIVFDSLSTLWEGLFSQRMVLTFLPMEVTLGDFILFVIYGSIFVMIMFSILGSVGD